MPEHGCQTIADLVRVLDGDQATISRWLDGSRDPTLGNYRKVAQQLDRTLAEVLVGAGIPEEEVGITATKPRRFAPVLVAIQNLLDRMDPEDKELMKFQQHWLAAMRQQLGMATERVDSIPHEPTAAQRQAQLRKGKTKE